jgi:hypothetical protein
MHLSTFFISTQPCVSIWKRPSCQAQVFSRAAFLGHQPGSNPQPADIGQMHLMLIWEWLGRTLVIIANAMGSLVRTLNDHLKSEPEPPDLRPSSNVDFPVAWITGPATDPSLCFGFLLTWKPPQITRFQLMTGEINNVNKPTKLSFLSITRKHKFR